MIRCIHLWSGSDQNSHFEEGAIELKPGSKSDLISGTFPIIRSFFQQTSPGGSFDWHTAPARQFVITLSGVLDFKTRTGEHFQLNPGVVLFAEDTIGTGHSWKLLGDDPWCRLYLVLEKNAIVPFKKSILVPLERPPKQTD
jgi:hypothetical protein